MYRKLTLLFLVCLALLLLVGSIIVIRYSIKYRNYVRTHYKEWLAKGSDSLYNIEVGSININVFNRTITIKDIYLFPDTTRIFRQIKEGKGPGAMVTVTVPKVKINGFMWEDLFLDKEINVGRLRVQKPTITFKLLTLQQRDSSLLSTEAPIATPQQNKNVVAPVKLFNHDIVSLSATTIEILEPKFIYEQYPKKLSDPWFMSVGGHIAVYHWKYKPGQPKDTSLLFYAQSGKVQIEHIAYYKPGSDYCFSLDTLHFDPATYTCDLRGLSIFPIVSKQNWLQAHAGYQRPQYHVAIPRIFLRQLNWQSFIYQDRLLADTVEVDNPEVHITVDRSGLEDTLDRTKNFPALLLSRMSLPFYMHTLAVRKGNVFYSEVSKVTKRSATLGISNINMALQHVTNIGQYIKNDSIIHLKGNGLLMNRGALNVDLQMNNGVGRTDFNLNLELKNLSHHELNSLSTNLALVELQSLLLKKIKLSGTGNKDSIRLHGTMLYDHLMIAIKKMDTAGGTIAARPMLTVLANQMALLRSNPLAGMPERTVQAIAFNEKKRSLVTLIWKGILHTAMHTVLQDADYVQMLNNRDIRKEQKLKQRQLRKERRALRRERKLEKRTAHP